MTPEAAAKHRAQNAAYHRRKGGRPVEIARSRPFPLQPLIDAVAHRCHPEGNNGMGRVGEENRLIGITRWQRQRYERDGLPVHVADRLAIRLELHPAILWGSYWWEVCDAEAFQESLWDAM